MKMAANEVPVMKKMKLLNTARGRKGAWHMRNTTKWDRAENIAREKAARANSDFVYHFIHDFEVVVEDTTSMYCAGLVREFHGSYPLVVEKMPEDEFLGSGVAGVFLAREYIRSTVRRPRD
jgi:hypothetical protein